MHASVGFLVRLLNSFYRLHHFQRLKLVLLQFCGITDQADQCGIQSFGHVKLQSSVKEVFLQLLHLSLVRALFQYNDHNAFPPFLLFRYLTPVPENHFPMNTKNRCLLRANTGLIPLSFNILKDFMKQMFYRSKMNLRYKNNPESQNNMLLSKRSFLLS